MKRQGEELRRRGWVVVWSEDSTRLMSYNNNGVCIVLYCIVLYCIVVEGVNGGLMEEMGEVW